MFRKIVFIIGLAFGSLTGHAQPACTGIMLNARQGIKNEICFLRTLNPIGNVTKYSIILDGREIYEVEFAYDQIGDSISIQLYDKQHALLKQEWVRLISADSHVLVYDFAPNKKPQQGNSTHRIVFGLDQPDKQYITLFQFQAIGGLQTQFYLQNVPEDLLSLHLKEVRLKESGDEISRNHALAISNLKKEMSLYADSIIRGIKERENAIAIKEANIHAENELLLEFTRRMDTIFYNYYKNIHNYRNEMFEGILNLACNGYGTIKVDTIKSIYFKTASQKNWFRDSFVIRLKPIIENASYRTPSETLTFSNLKTDFSTWFERRFAEYSNLGPDDRDSFSVEQKNIYQQLDAYSKRTVNSPAVYIYNFKYQSTVKYPEWRYVRESSATDRFIDKSESASTIEITEDLKQIFRRKYGMNGTGRYALRVSTVTLNNALKTQDIALIQKK